MDALLIFLTLWAICFIPWMIVTTYDSCFAEDEIPFWARRLVVCLVGSFVIAIVITVGFLLFHVLYKILGVV